MRNTEITVVALPNFQYLLPFACTSVCPWGGARGWWTTGIHDPSHWRETARCLLERAVSDWSVKSLFRRLSPNVVCATARIKKTPGSTIVRRGREDGGDEMSTSSSASVATACSQEGMVSGTSGGETPPFLSNIKDDARRRTSFDAVDGEEDLDDDVRVFSCKV